jgi:ABC-2 type transport system permease protein
MSAVRPLSWFAQHEARLGWRDMLAMMTAGRPNREGRVALWIAAFAVALHGVAYLVIRNYVGREIRPDPSTLIAVTATILLSASAMLSQAMESVTRTFYTRSDLELILSAPVPAEKLFAVRIGAMALSAALMSILLMGPFINILIWRGGWRWLGAYGVLIAVSLMTTALAIVLTIKLFQVIGPRRTRLAAQIVAALVGGIFVIGLQMAAMFSSDTLSRAAFLRSSTVLAHAPGEGSIFWEPARAALGDWRSLAWVLGGSLLVFAAVTARYAPRFAGYVLAASSVSQRPRQKPSGRDRFHVGTPAAALRRKERLLILRDPWLISQSLMQLLYLSPPAILLWHNYGRGGAAIVLVPVLIMAAGQLAGGLAWLTISGEDAPDLVGSAPVASKRLLWAKVEAVMQCIGLVFCPFIVALVLVSARQALVAVAGISAAAISSTAIQLWFRSQAKRSQFRRRHTSSRIATLAEAFVSIIWAAAGGIAVSGSPLWVIVALIAVILLWCIWRFSPARLR